MGADVYRLGVELINLADMAAGVRHNPIFSRFGWHWNILGI